jgi:hypothetical protein
MVLQWWVVRRRRSVAAAFRLLVEEDKGLGCNFLFFQGP